jgi:hypothetical protein
MSIRDRGRPVPGGGMTTLYGHKALAHWARWLPLHYSAIPDPIKFFNYLGERVLDEVDALADEIAEDDPPSEEYWDKVQRLTMARHTAEELILPDLLLPEPRRYHHPDDDISIRVRDLLQQAADTSNDEQDEELWRVIAGDSSCWSSAVSPWGTSSRSSSASCAVWSAWRW